MRITIDHCRYTPKWDSLQTIIREATNDESCVITRISRVDKGCDYRKPGEYDLDVTRDNQTILPVKLVCVAVGHRIPCPECGCEWAEDGLCPICMAVRSTHGMGNVELAS